MCNVERLIEVWIVRGVAAGPYEPPAGPFKVNAQPVDRQAPNSCERYSELFARVRWLAYDPESRTQFFLSFQEGHLSRLDRWIGSADCPLLPVADLL